MGAAGLVVVQLLNEWAGWWSYSSGGAMFCGMAVELYLGWVVLWGVVPQLAFSRLGIGWCAVLMVVADLVGMPLCRGVLVLGPRWLVGEAVAVAIVLAPALCVARWTLEETHLRWRAAMQVAMSGMVFLFFLPEVAFALRPGERLGAAAGDGELAEADLAAGGGDDGGAGSECGDGVCGAGRGNADSVRSAEAAGDEWGLQVLRESDADVLRGGDGGLGGVAAEWMAGGGGGSVDCLWRGDC